jgi:hypothetical protein
MLKCIDAYYYHHDAHSSARARGCGWRRLGGGEAAGQRTMRTGTQKRALFVAL